MQRSEITQKFNLTLEGAGEPAVVLAHGFGSDQTAWRHQAASLAPAHRVVRFDHLGCGKAAVESYDPREYCSIERHAEDVLAIYEALGLTDTVYVGHSVGGMIGMLVSLARPDLFRKLVFIGASPRYLNDGDYIGGFTREDLDTLYAVMAGDYLGWANGFGPLVMASDDRPELGREFARTLTAMRPDLAQTAARVIFEADFRPHLGAIRQPVLILQAIDDPIVPRHVAEYLAARIPNSRLELIHGRGHVPHLSAPEAVTAAISRFLAE